MQQPDTTSPQTSAKNIWGVITASSVGTLIEWYDFYIFGSLAASGIIAKQFFPSDNPTAAFLSSLATFAAGFVVRPFGALFFGRLGDLIGRKYTFLVTLLLMGGATFLIGLVPSYAAIGVAAPLMVLTLRLLQGLALGGEYGGAATYVAEHSPANQRGYYTSFIQTTATLGLLLSIGMILMVQSLLGSVAFDEWGWRIPFLVSIFLVGISFYIRLRMHESPLFVKVKAEGKISSNPLKESFAKKDNLKMVLLTLFGATAGQGVVWYTGQYYALAFMNKTCNIDSMQANQIIMIAILAVTPFFVVFGAWSDKIGRKGIMMLGMLLAIFAYRPIYHIMYDIADLKQKQEITNKIQINKKTETIKGDKVITLTTEKIYTDGTQYKEIGKTTHFADKSKTPKAGELKKSTTLNSSHFWVMTGLIFLQIFFVTMVYGPIAAFLVELFPTRIRYTSMSLPYHVGNGIFGGLTPYIASRIVESSKASGSATYYLDGLWYPIAIAAVSFVIGMVYLSPHYKPQEQEEDTVPQFTPSIRGKEGIIPPSGVRGLGFVCLLLGPALILMAFRQATQELQAITPEKLQETLLFWVIIMLIFVPIMAGLSLFGWYALKGEYKSAP
jgi:MHS family proline/betaine transporter-like MFS transporter